MVVARVDHRFESGTYIVFAAACLDHVSQDLQKRYLEFDPETRMEIPAQPFQGTERYKIAKRWIRQKSMDCNGTVPFISGFTCHCLGIYRNGADPTARADP